MTGKAYRSRPVASSVTTNAYRNTAASAFHSRTPRFHSDPESVAPAPTQYDTPRMMMGQRTNQLSAAFRTTTPRFSFPAAVNHTSVLNSNRAATGKSTADGAAQAKAGSRKHPAGVTPLQLKKAAGGYVFRSQTPRTVSMVPGGAAPVHSYVPISEHRHNIKGFTIPRSARFYDMSADDCPPPATAYNNDVQPARGISPRPSARSPSTMDAANRPAATPVSTSSFRSTSPRLMKRLDCRSATPGPGAYNLDVTKDLAEEKIEKRKKQAAIQRLVDKGREEAIGYRRNDLRPLRM